MYNALKTDLALFLGISKDALHIHVGLALFFGLAVVLRRSPASLLPWLGVLVFEFANEIMDIFHWHRGVLTVEVGDSIKDVVNTMIWPTVMLLAFRAMRSQHHKPAGDPVTGNSN